MVEKEIYNFIWKGKKDKIKRSAAINLIEKGGLNMVDFRSTIKAAKAMWVKRYVSDKESQWKRYMDFFLRDVGGKFLFSCQFSTKSLSLNLPQFYKDVINSWSYLIKDINGKNRETIIWNNKHITFQGKSLFFPQLHKAGIVKVKHLFTADMGTIPFQVWVDQNIGITWNNYFQWNIMIKSILNSVETNADNLDGDIIFYWQGKHLEIKNLRHKIAYEMFVTNKAERPTAMKGIIEMFNLDENNEEDIKNIYTIAKRSEVDNKKKEFQYKILNQLLAVNFYLKKVGIINTDTCQFCKTESETIRHLLFDCSITKLFWCNFQNWWENLTKEKINLGFKDVILGYKLNECPKEINYFILTAKYFIFQSKINSKELHFKNFMSLLRKEFHIDKERCRIYNRKKILDKWNKINFA